MVTQADKTGNSRTSPFQLVQWLAIIVLLVAVLVFIWQQNKLANRVDLATKKYANVEVRLKNLERGPNSVTHTGEMRSGTGAHRKRDAAAPGTDAKGAGASQGIQGSEEIVLEAAPAPDANAPQGLRTDRTSARRSKDARQYRRGNPRAARAAMASKIAKRRAIPRQHRVYLNVGNYATRAAALRERNALLGIGLPATMRVGRGGYGVTLGPFQSAAQAQRYAHYVLRAAPGRSAVTEPKLR
ncbi:MAG: SPOR domain-containing protein [Ignavibacteria bacterium]|nr:SPOR domain-containing protein [Ignavibacteria bacterium]